MMDGRKRVLHFVTGGFSGGATQVAIAVVNAAVASAATEPLLVLRSKRHTPTDRIEALRAAGTPLTVVPGWSRLATIIALVRLCRRLRPDVLVAYGFSEHLWGRLAGLIAGVPCLVQVEQNTKERYSALHLVLTRWLARRSAAIVGCSEGVRVALQAQGLPSEQLLTIPNGIQTAAFAAAGTQPWHERESGIVMVARFSRQKNHATLLRAVALLAERGLHPRLLLAGGGKPLHRKPVERLARELGIAGQVVFLGVCRNVPELLMRQRVAVLSTRWEGLPLALIEGMAAGCAVIGSAVPGVRELLRDGIDGRLVPADDAQAMADALAQLLRDDGPGATMAEAARERALLEFSRERMNARYEAMIESLAEGRGIPAQLR